MNKDSNIEGLRERIAIAKSPEDVSKLLDEGSTYVSASEKTRRAWRNTAAKRLTELEGAQRAKDEPADTIPDNAPVVTQFTPKEKQVLHGKHYGRRMSPLAATLMVGALMGGAR